MYVYAHTQIERVWYVLWTVLPGDPGIPGDPAHVRMEERHGKNICIHCDG